MWLSYILFEDDSTVIDDLQSQYVAESMFSFLDDNY